MSTNRLSILFPIALSLFALPACDGSGVDQDGILEEQVDESLDGKDDSVKLGQFETFTGRDGKFYFHMLSGNGQKVLQSQGYTTKASAEKGVDSVRVNGEYADGYQILEAQDGRSYLNLYAGNGQIIATSQMYSTKSNAQRGLDTAIALVKGANLRAAALDARFQVFRGIDGKFYFHLRAANGEIVLQSQGYTTRASATNGIASVRSNGRTASHYQVRDAVNGQSYFVLNATNGQVVGVSELFTSRSNAERSVSAVTALLSGNTAPLQQ